MPIGLVGKNGSARIGTANILFIDSWSLNPSRDLIEITSYGSSFKTRTTGLRDWSASISGSLDKSSTAQSALLDQLSTGSTSNVAWRFYTSSVAFWAGSALTDSWTVNSSISDKVTVSFSIKGNGALSYTTAT